MSRANLERLTTEIKQFEKYLAPTPFEKDAREGLFKKIELAVTQLIPDASVAPYGSYETQLLLPSSDIDVSIQVIGRNPRNILRDVKKHIRKYHYDTMYTGELVLQAVVPVFHLRDRQTSLTADITVQNTVSSSSRTVAWLVEYPDLKPLFLLLKHALLGIRLHSDPYYEIMNPKRSGVASYSLICLIVHYFKYNHKAQTFTDSAIRLGELLLGFLSFYSVFDFDGIGLTFQTEKGYYDKAIREYDYFNQSFHNTGMTIVNPDDPNANVARATNTTNQFQAILKWMHTQINTAVNEDDTRHSYLASIITVEAHPVDVSRKSLNDYKFPVKYLDSKALGVQLQPVDTSKFADKKGVVKRGTADKVSRYHPYRRGSRRRGQKAQ
ncbi:hypothetical protein BJV82DRAFT_612223 [Fennellomyces sp. T-0311]|nr:hypothetical protein BJV82DRAFT_612223 [Fennellomyces sp. T-0311]